MMFVHQISSTLLNNYSIKILTIKNVVRISICLQIEKIRYCTIVLLAQYRIFRIFYIFRSNVHILQYTVPVKQYSVLYCTYLYGIKKSETKRSACTVLYLVEKNNIDQCSFLVVLDCTCCTMYCTIQYTHRTYSTKHCIRYTRKARKIKNQNRTVWPTDATTI